MSRKRYSEEFKLQVVHEAMETRNNAVVARRHDLNPQVVGRWVRDYKNATLLKNTKSPDIAKQLEAEYKEAVAENDQLKKILGEKDLEIAILKDLLKKTNPHLKIR